MNQTPSNESTTNVKKNDLSNSQSSFANLIFNLFLPLLILNKGGQYLSPQNSLILALSFPLGYGIWDYYQTKKINPISALGLLNVLITGGLALTGLTGIWFAVKEAAFPLLIGIFVAASAYSKKPFISQLILNPQVFKIDQIQNRIAERNKAQEFTLLLKNSTLLLSASFLLSAILNFVLAKIIFTDISAALNEIEKQQHLNDQIAKMTAWSFGVIMVPSILFLVFIMFYMINGLKKITGFEQEELFNA